MKLLILPNVLIYVLHNHPFPCLYHARMMEHLGLLRRHHLPNHALVAWGVCLDRHPSLCLWVLEVLVVWVELRFLAALALEIVLGRPDKKIYIKILIVIYKLRIILVIFNVI
jgi:hypothetical protein